LGVSLKNYANKPKNYASNYAKNLFNHLIY